MTEHGNIILELQRERSQLLDRLSKANALLAGAAAHMRIDKVYTDAGLTVHHSPSKNECLVEIDEFLKAGLFGEAKGSEPK